MTTIFLLFFSNLLPTNTIPTLGHPTRVDEISTVPFFYAVTGPSFGQQAGEQQEKEETEEKKDTDIERDPLLDEAGKTARKSKTDRSRSEKDMKEAARRADQVEYDPLQGNVEKKEKKAADRDRKKKKRQWVIELDEERDDAFERDLILQAVKEDGDKEKKDKEKKDKEKKDKEKKDKKKKNDKNGDNLPRLP